MWKFWSEPETGNNELYVYACVSCVQSIIRYNILSMPLHLFQDDAIAVLIIILKRWLLEKKCKTS